MLFFVDGLHRRQRRRRPLLRDPRPADSPGRLARWRPDPSARPEERQEPPAGPGAGTTSRLSADARETRSRFDRKRRGGPADVRHPAARVARAVLRDPGGRFGLVVVVTLLGLALSAPRVAPFDPFVIGADEPLAHRPATTSVRDGRAGARRPVADALRRPDLAHRGVRLGRRGAPRGRAPRSPGRLPRWAGRHGDLAAPRHDLRLPRRPARHRRGRPAGHGDRERGRGGGDHQRPHARPADPRGGAEPAKRGVRAGGPRAGRFRDRAS